MPNLEGDGYFCYEGGQQKDNFACLNAQIFHILRNLLSPADNVFCVAKNKKKLSSECGTCDYPQNMILRQKQNKNTFV